MQGLHSLAHRAPTGVTRAKARWQPYNALPPSVSSRSPTTTTYLNTPLSVSSASPYSTPASFDSDKLKSQTVISSNPKDSSSKHTKYALGLVDQAVKSLCEIWRNQDIPSVFLTTLSSTAHPSKAELVSTAIHTRNIQLPSPISPNTRHPSPNASPMAPCEQELFGSRSNLVPIKGFVHEVLRRSRTSGCVLQTALCYLEAIRSKVPELAQQERSGSAAKVEPELADRITPATPAEIEQDAELTRLSLNDDESYDDMNMDTVKLSDLGGAALPVDSDGQMMPTSSSEPLTPLPPLPSPLLCPRRAFLAALILASKFTQDKCYSNRAWAKLSGLPPREIGRCERALGDALDWRLWVGKRPVASQPISTPAPPLVTRPLVRCQSESNLKTPTKKSKFLDQDDSRDPKPSGNALRRSSTLPANAFSTQGTSNNLVPERNSDADYAMMVELSSLSMIPSEHTQLSSDLSVCPPTEILDPNPPVTFSPCPSLSYSPSSTDSSSSGDGTIQMSTLDEMPPLNNSGSVTNPTSDSTWLWSESPPAAQHQQPLARYSPAIRIRPPPPIGSTLLAKPPPPIGIGDFKHAPLAHVQIAGSASSPEHRSLASLADPWNSQGIPYRWPTIQ